MNTARAYKSLCQEDKLFLQDTAQKVAMLVAKPPKTMDYFRKQLTEFADKWTAYETAKEAERKGKWQPSMGRPSNPLWAIWPRTAGASCFPDFGDIRPVLGAYTLLAVIHDKVLPRCPSIATEILPKELVNKIWRDLITGANEESSSSRKVIPVLKIENFLGGVKVDIENHFAPKNSPRKIHPYFQFVDQNHSGQKNGTTQKLAETSSGKAGDKKTMVNDKKTHSKKALALATLKDHPDWTDEQIAQEVGVSRTTLYDWQDFKKAKEILKQGKNDIPRGSKNGKTGDIEAWDDKT